MQTIKQSEKANCTREEARALLEDLREAYQALALEERKQVRDTLTRLSNQGMAINLPLPGAELMLGVR